MYLRRKFFTPNRFHYNRKYRAEVLRCFITLLYAFCKTVNGMVCLVGTLLQMAVESLAGETRIYFRKRFAFVTGAHRQG